MLQVDKALISGCLISLAFLTGSPQADASFYPPDYIIEKQCQQQGPVEICAINQHYGSFPRLQITYWGFLLDEEWGQIFAYVSLNGYEIFTPMVNRNYTETLMLNDPHAYLCRPGGAETEEGPYPRCHYTEGEGGVLWELEAPPPEEAALFTHAKDEQGFATNWDVELAFSSKSGRWDSNDSANYRFRFAR